MSKLKCMDADWRFHLGDVPDAGYMAYDDRAWIAILGPKFRDIFPS